MHAEEAAVAVQEHSKPMVGTEMQPIANPNQAELDHSIGYSGKVVNGVHLNPATQDYALVAGCSVVIRDIQDPHN
jgi:hypothetical protein